MSHLSLTPTSPQDAAGAPIITPSKQLHPSESQLRTEQAVGIAGEEATSATPVIFGGGSLSGSGPLLAAPKPAIIETRTGPVSPKISPRTLSRSPGTRSPAYSASSSPRASSRTLGSIVSASGAGVKQQEQGGTLNMSGVDEVTSLSSTTASIAAAGASSAEQSRRGSGGANMASMLSSAGINGSAASAASPSASQSPTPHMLVRRASKPLILSGSNGSNSQLQALLARYTVRDVMNKAAGIQAPHPNTNPAHASPAKTVIELPSTATPAEGFELLLNNNILSCPVWDAANKNYIGFLDVRDLVSSIVFAHEEQKLTASFSDQWNELMLAGMQRFGTAVSVTYLSRRNPFRPMAPSATLLQVARALSTQLHRVPIVDESGKCVSIMSQSILVQFLYSHRDELKDDLRQSVGALGLGLTKVVCVASDATAWQAFKTLELNGVSGIAMVDREGKLVGNTSARDLKFFVLNRGTLSLDAPIQDYLARIRQRDLAHEEARHPSCSISVGTNLGHCVGLLAATGYHRVFIVDAAGRPVGVVSITDILRFASAETAGNGGSASSGSSSQSPSNPTTPRGNKPVAASGSPAAGVNTPHLRSNSQSHTPVVTPMPNAQ